jgi:hypothetical protein
MLRIFKALYLIANIAIIIALLSIHFVFKESTYQYSLYYYTFPLPIIIGVILGLSIFLSKTYRKYNLLLAAALLLLWLERSFKIHFAEDIKDSDIEVVFWNGSHKRNVEDAFDLNKGIPDVLVLVEHGQFKVKKIRNKYPNYFLYVFKNGISVFSKTSIKFLNEVSSNYKTTIINFEAEGINFFAIDVSGSMDVPREWELTFVKKYIQHDKNTVLLGDFNVPYESMHFDAIKPVFNHAFSKKGNGFRETWFWNIPLLSLDHIWVSKDLKVLKTEKMGTFKSDHSMLKTIIRK